MKKISLIILAFWGLSHVGHAQSELPDAKIKVLMDFPKEGRNSKNGKGFSANVGLLEKDRLKVALVSFFVFDPGFTKSFSYSTSTHNITKYKYRNSGGFAPIIAAGALDVGLEPMKEELAKAGLDLMLPDEYLDTPDKKAYFEKFQVDHEGFSDWTRNMGGGNHQQAYGTPEGFIVADVVNEPYANYEVKGIFPVRTSKVADNNAFLFNKDTKMTASLGYDLASKLGVDAVMVVYMTCFAPKDSKIELVNATMLTFGPNPNMPEGNESKHGVIPHATGLFYCGTRVNPEVPILNVNKKKPETQKLDFAGFDAMLREMAKSTAEYFNDNRKKS